MTKQLSCVFSFSRIKMQSVGYFIILKKFNEYDHFSQEFNDVNF